MLHGSFGAMTPKVILICLGFSFQYNLISATESCKDRNTCQECISDPNICIWCGADDFNATTTNKRCVPLSSYEDSWCPGFVQNPTNLVVPSKPKDFSSDPDHVVQIKPQHYTLKLRSGMEARFNFSFQGAKDFPVDLYFLLDASITMEGIKKMTAANSQKIYLTIKDMTKNIRLGLGTFVDKRVLPFTNNTMDTELTYSFRHRLNLTADFKQFEEMVSSTPNGINRDPQEGGLDALAQVLVCKDKIGWRNEARKIVIFLTDGEYHAAGDGKSAGLFQPYDGKCYTENGIYTKELEMDYPSVGMISKLAAEHDTTIIFLVDSKVKEIYQDLSGAVSGSKLVKFPRDREMKDDTIVTLLKDIYGKISKKVKLKTKLKLGNKKMLNIKFEPDCTNDNSDSGCVIEIGKELFLGGTVQYNDTQNAVIDIIVEGVGEKLTLNIDIIKKCGCEDQVQYNSSLCHGEPRMCGICNCSDNRYGEQCACVKSINNDFNSNSTCIADGSMEVCSGHGSCICGTCLCRKRYEGKFCQCNLDSCPRSHGSGEVCNGVDYGKCQCDGKCKCQTDWTGAACDCYKSDTDCKGIDGSICHNRGHCECGVCQCDDIAKWDARSMQVVNCQMNCDDCHELQCRKLEGCAKCQRNQQDECPYCDPRFRIEVVKALSDEHLNSSLWNTCDNVKVEIGCTTRFVYQYDDSAYTVELVVETQKDCAPTYYKFGGLFLLIIVLTGAGTLIAWKLLTEARDRREYLQFSKANKEDGTGPCTNPLYEPPTSTFYNPGFRKRSVDVR